MAYDNTSGDGPACARCGGPMIGGELLAQGADRNLLHRTDAPLNASTNLVAWACSECGWVDFYLADIEQFLGDEVAYDNDEPYS